MINATEGAREDLAMERYRLYLGPLYEYLADENTTSITANEDDSVWVEQFNKPKFKLDKPMPMKSRASLISYLANQQFGQAMDSLHSRLQCDLPVFGSRVQAFCNPISNWPIILRNHARHIVSFEHYKETAAPDTLLTESWGEDRIRVGWFDAILQAIEQRRNISVAGSVKSGKTTFVNTLVNEHAQIYPRERLVVVQDRREIVSSCFPDAITLMARVEQARSGESGSTTLWTYEFKEAVEDAMRCDGDAFVWGEVRDPFSAIGLASASNTGTRGIKMTIHSNSAEDTPDRLEDFFRQLGRQPIKRQIAKLNELIIYMQRDPVTNKGRIIDVQRVLDVVDGEYVFERVQPGKLHAAA